MNKKRKKRGNQILLRKPYRGKWPLPFTGMSRAFDAKKGCLSMPSRSLVMFSEISSPSINKWQKGFCKGDVNPAPSFIFPECSRIDLLQRCTSNQHCYLYRVEILLKLASLSYLFVIRQIQSPTNPCTLSYYWKDEVGEVQLFCFRRRILNCIQ